MTKKPDSIVRFLNRWINEPVPQHIIDAGCDVLEIQDQYQPEKVVHQIVTKCVMLWIEDVSANET